MNDRADYIMIHGCCSAHIVNSFVCKCHPGFVWMVYLLVESSTCVESQLMPVCMNGFYDCE